MRIRLGILALRVLQKYPIQLQFQGAIPVVLHVGVYVGKYVVEICGGECDVHVVARFGFGIVGVVVVVTVDTVVDTVVLTVVIAVVVAVVVTVVVGFSVGFTVGWDVFAVGVAVSWGVSCGGVRFRVGFEVGRGDVGGGGGGAGFGFRGAWALVVHFQQDPLERGDGPRVPSFFVPFFF